MVDVIEVTRQEKKSPTKIVQNLLEIKTNVKFEIFKNKKIREFWSENYVNEIGWTDDNYKNQTQVNPF